MKVDTSRSRYSESPTARADFSRQEVRHCRMLLRRLQFLEMKVREADPMVDNASGASAFVEWEMLALEWVLVDNGYLVIREVDKTGESA